MIRTSRHRGAVLSFLAFLKTWNFPRENSVHWFCHRQPKLMIRVYRFLSYATRYVQVPEGVIRYISDGDVRRPFFGFEICDLRTFFGFEIL